MTQNFHILNFGQNSNPLEIEGKINITLVIKFVKDYEVLSFARNIVGKNINKNLSSKYSQKLLDHTKQSATDALETTSKKAIQKTAEAIGDLTGNKISDRITNILKSLPKNNSETNEEEILRERYISPDLRRKIIDDLRLKEENY